MLPVELFLPLFRPVFLRVFLRYLVLNLVLVCVVKSTRSRAKPAPPPPRPWEMGAEGAEAANLAAPYVPAAKVTRSEEHKRAISEALTAKWKDPKYRQTQEAAFQHPLTQAKRLASRGFGGVAKV